MSSGDLGAIFGQGFNVNSVEPQGDFDVIPPGKYPVLIEKAEVKQTKKGDGHYIKLTLAVLDGQFKNRKVFDNINIQNPSQQCVEIGLRQLAALGQSVGLVAIQDTAQLINQACIAHVKVKDDQNEVRTYSPLTPAGAPGVLQVPYQPAPPQTQYAPVPPQPQYPAKQMPPQTTDGAPGKPPWAR